MTTITRAPPEHFIFGRRPSASGSKVKLRKKGDLFYSESNFNLLLDRDITDFTLGSFLHTLRFGTIWKAIEAEGYYEPVKLLEDSLENSCSSCQKRNGVACALLQRPGYSAPPDATVQDLVRASQWTAGGRERALDLCALVGSLREMTETQAERRFLDLYTLHVLRWALPEKTLERAYGGELFPDYRQVQPGDWLWMWDVQWALLRLLGHPALIPQVVLNLVVPKDLPDGHPDKDFYDHNVGRVDFLFLQGGAKHVVEIDGPYHHRDEEEYTRLLRRDRSLRRQGYVVHRFSNLEVVQAAEFSEFGLF